MCLACAAFQIPVCTINGSCGVQVHQLFQLALLTAGPVTGGLFVWIKDFAQQHKPPLTKTNQTANQ